MINTMREAVGLARQGSKEGQAYLYEQTYRKAYYVALKYMQNEDNALDVVQDAYIKAFSRLEQLDDDDKFDKWINSIVASTALDALKKKKPQLFTDMSNDDEEFDVSERFEANYTEQPEVVVDQNETARLVQEIISELSDEQRACVTMYYMQEMSVKEISGILNVSDNTVKSRLNYARKNIEAKVKELEKKGTKLYALAPIPFFVFLLHTEADACEATAVAGMYSIISGTGTASSSTGASVSTGANTTHGTGTTSGAGTSTRAGAIGGKAATGLSLGIKIAIGIISAIVVIGGAIGVWVAVNNNSDSKFVGTWIENDNLDGIDNSEIKKYLGRWRVHFKNNNNNGNFTTMNSSNIQMKHEPNYSDLIMDKWVVDERDSNLIYSWGETYDGNGVKTGKIMMTVFRYENDTLQEEYSEIPRQGMENYRYKNWHGDLEYIKQPREEIILYEDHTGVYKGGVINGSGTSFDEVDVEWSIKKNDGKDTLVLTIKGLMDYSTSLDYLEEKNALEMLPVSSTKPDRDFIYFTKQ